MDIDIQAIRKHAVANYTNGWDVVVEAFTDAEILEHAALYNCTNTAKTLVALQEYVDLRSEYENEIHAAASW
jgi:hypothetical protein